MVDPWRSDLIYRYGRLKVARGVNTYKLFHAVGEERLAGKEPVLASRRRDRSAALVWNMPEAKQAAGIPGATSDRKVTGSVKQFDIRFAGARPGARVRVRLVDKQRGSPMPAWRRMGSSHHLTRAQIAVLRRAADIADLRR